MNSDLLTKWTAILTNIAVVIGLAFVGLEFRNNTRAVEAERIDSFIQGSHDITALTIENGDLAEILYQAHANPSSLSGSDLDRAQHWMLMHYDNFRRTMLAHQAGLIPDEIYERQKIGTGFIFSSDIGLSLIASMQASALRDSIWETLNETAEEARIYCLNPQNVCVARYEAARDDKG